jgi:hypothetical protein
VNARLAGLEQAMRLRRLRVQVAEIALNRRRLELEEALGELESAHSIRAAWHSAAAELEQWIAGSSQTLHRWSELVAVRRRDFDRGREEARRYVEWWESQVSQARAAEQAARPAWSAERARLDALVRRHAVEARRDAARTDEAIFEEQADAAAAALAARGMQ